MQAVGVIHHHLAAQPAVVGNGGRLGSGLRRAGWQHRLFRAQRAERLGGDLIQRQAGTGRHHSGQGTLDQRGRAEPHPCAQLRGQQFEGGLGAQEGAAQVHQHQHAAAVIRLFNRTHHRDGIGADGVVGVIDPGRQQQSGRAAELVGQRFQAGRQQGAVRDHYDSDHVTTSLCHAGRSAAAGSRWPRHPDGRCCARQDSWRAPCGPASGWWPRYRLRRLPPPCPAHR